MGTNYYFEFNFCKHCGRSDTVHLGKHAGGWRFILQWNGGKFYKSWKEMKKWLKEEVKKGGKIYNNYNEEVKLKDFIKIVEKTRKDPTWFDTHFMFDEDGYLFCDTEFS